MRKQQRKAVAELKRRHRALARRLARTGLILQGTITPRTLVRPDPQAPARSKTYGPYYQWTFKRAGKTVTVNLSAAQAKVFQKAINQHREMEKIIGEMRRLSLGICESTSQGGQEKKSQERWKVRLKLVPFGTVPGILGDRGSRVITLFLNTAIPGAVPSITRFQI